MEPKCVRGKGKYRPFLLGWVGISAGLSSSDATSLGLRAVRWSFDDFVLVSKIFLSRKRLEVYSEVKGVNGDLNVYGLTCMTFVFFGGKGGGTGSHCLDFHLHCRLLTFDISPS